MKEYYLNDEIYYRTNEFKPDRLTLVFVHGISGSSSAWLPYEKIFENKYNILTYDIRGHGMSKKYSNFEDYEVENFVNDLDALVSYLKISKFVLISNSFAALIALEYLKIRRDTVVANIFTSPEVYLGEGILAKVALPVLKLVSMIIGIFPFDPRPRGHVDYTKHINSTDWDIGRNFADMRNTSFRVHFFALRQSFLCREDYALEKINVPTLIMHGEKDTLIPMRNAIRMSKEIKNSKFVSIPGVDHNTVHNAVKIMSETFSGFLERAEINITI
ncbi:MAG: alpha/beta hydrolase [Candidatus Paceibacterota bacterium]|jgi:pimeloyl-ACP methyl ester carboxylesterase